MVKITIAEGQRGLLYRNGVPVEYLRPGRHRRRSLLSEQHVEVIDLFEGVRALDPGVDRVLPGEDAFILTVPAEHVALVRRDGQPFVVLRPGKYVLWQVERELTAELVSLEARLTDMPVAFRVLAGSNLIEDVVVRPYERVLLYVDGVLVQTLEAGRHGVVRHDRMVELRRIDLREQELQVAGQELITHDKVSLRLNLVLRYRIVDPVAAVQEVDDLRDALYAEVQLVARRALAALTVDALLDQRTEMARDLVAEVGKRAEPWGVQIRRLEIKDIVLPGDMKVLLNRVIEAEKRAAAQNILRREEVAATRSLANTARMLNDNPMLRRLKEVESIKEIAEQIPNLTVVIAPKDLQEHLRLGDS